MNNVKVHDRKYREAKKPQGNPSAEVTGANSFLGITVAAAILESGGDVVCLDAVDVPTSSDWKAAVASAKKHSRILSYNQCDLRDAEGVSPVSKKFTPTLRHPIRGLVACFPWSRDKGGAENQRDGEHERIRVEQGGLNTAGYNASKAAVHQLARSLAAEWGSRAGMPLVRVNSLSPAYIRTAATAEGWRSPAWSYEAAKAL
ncbi:Uu.00g070460.m01.CDS01 [Anthostomella pinea]|uniref:Uu.00g070460.m01.CDS01 n=1 Tax=Anthostomella pinea TaxID=933095 RepID=A0AAI8YNS7_9PEZI|nr:Uu.00g070460.m01.CDS01 [Anthostomella pinea]